MAKNDPELRIHKDWLGLIQPVGLVVSPPALVKAQAVLNQDVAELQQKFLSVVDKIPESVFGGEDEPFISDLLSVFRTVFGWSDEDVAGAEDGPTVPEGLELVLPDYNETLRPTYVVVDSMGDGKALMLVQTLPRSTPLDEAPDEGRKAGWSASPQVKLERLLREVKVPVGLLCNGDAMRLVYAPSGESSGHLTFPTAAMCEVGGRPILAALHMLFSEHRLFSAPDGRRLIDILSESRKYQAEVSNALSDQVLGALWELLRGFQASDPEDGQRIFDQTAREEPEHIYGGLLTLLMRLIFVLYAEDEGLMPEGDVYANNYSVSGLYNRLRSDVGRYPDTMDQRYGAYAWLLSLFRLVFDGGGHGGLRLPTRHGQLFNPDEFAFLEGRSQGVGRVLGDKDEAPRVSDGCIYRVLDALLVLDGERLSYRALDVEQIGSVYEAMMGYDVERAFGRSIAVRPKHIVVDVDKLLGVDRAKRIKWLKGQAYSELSGASAIALKVATTPEEVVAALGRRVSPRSLDVAGTPRLMEIGSLFLQPGEERRRTGSHYTPRELTEPIVRTALRPVLEALGERPTPEVILGLKVCDPAMGSGAFLVETCRQISERLVTAWEVHSAMPQMPPDEEPILHARRLVAQRCLYGVDKNPFAVNLAKLSLWLVTLAKDHAFTFLDHSLRHGDSLVGLTKKQVAAFHWKVDTGLEMDFFEEKLKKDLKAALGWRDALQDFDDGKYNRKKEAWWEAENALADARLIGDLVVAAFFGADKEKSREELRTRHRNKVEAWRAKEIDRHELEEIVEELREGEKPVSPMHWEIEFPEVFGRKNPGFDVIVGNPPFLGGSKLSSATSKQYMGWLSAFFEETKGKSDLVAYFFRQGFALVGRGGTVNFVSTNSIRQGDTRYSGLRWIRAHEGHVFSATRRRKWPGIAAVVVSVVHIIRGLVPRCHSLDKMKVDNITSYLLPFGPDEDPFRISSNNDLAHSGVNPNGKGFIISSEKKAELVSQDPRSEERIHEFLGSSEMNTNPDTRASRYAISLAGLGESDVEDQYPVLYEHLFNTVRVQRLTSAEQRLRESWWLFSRPANALYKYSTNLQRVLVSGRVATWLTFTFQAPETVFSDGVTVFMFEDFASFASLQSSVHCLWARFLGSSFKDDPRYIPEDCFETFPFPESWQTEPALEVAGRDYYEFRAGLMAQNDEGLTKTYNGFHDPGNHDADIVKLRELHVAMDRVFLNAYGWDDISTDCEFLLDYEIDEETWGKKKKPYRYRWPEAVHDEVLARLLDLNQKWYQEEVTAGLREKKSEKKAIKKKVSRKNSPESTNLTLPLYGEPMKSPEEN